MQDEKTQFIKKSSTGVFWRTLQGLGSKGIEFVVQIILARLLLPEDFGTVAILAIFANLASTIVNNGLTSSLLQKKNATETDYSTVFIIEFILAILMYALLFFLAPVIANYYNDVMITQYLRVYSLMILFSSISSIQTTVLRSKADYRTLFFGNLIGIIVQAFLGVFLAYRGMGVWALVISQVSYYGVSTILLCVFVRWVPRKKVSFKSFVELFKFSWKMTVGWLIGNLYNDIFSLVVGKKYDKDTLGYYSKAQTVPSTVNQIANQVTNSVMFPVFAKIQDEKELTKKNFGIMIAVLGALLFPIMAGIAGAGNQIISILFTDKWLPCVPMMQILCISFGLNIINNANMQTITGNGRSDLFMIFELIKRGLAIVLVLVLSSISIYLMIWSIVIVDVISLIINGIANKKLFDYSFKKYIFDVIPYILYSIVLFVGVYFINYLPLNKYSVFLLQLSVCVTYYFALIFFSRLPGFRVLRTTVINFIENKKKKWEIKYAQNVVKAKKINYQIVGLRAFFCVFIMLYHYLIRYFDMFELAPIISKHWVPDAIVFVSNFFILSGMFLNIKNIKKFWTNKLLKIVIPTVLCMLVIFGVASICEHQMAVGPIDLIMNCLILPLFTGRFAYIDGAHWYVVYLVYIFVIFTIFYLIAFCLENKKIIDYLMFVFGIIIFVIAVIPSSENMIYKLFNLCFNNRMIFIVLGYFLNKFIALLKDKSSSKNDKVIYGSFFGASAIFSVVVLLKSYFWINTIYFVVVFGIVILCLMDKLKFLKLRPLQIIGNVSLWIYLLHQNIGYLIINYFNGIDLYWLGVIISILLIIFVSIVFSSLHEKMLKFISKKEEKA